MKLLNKDDALKRAFHNVFNNELLKESIIKFQNEIVSIMHQQPKTIALVAPKNRLQSALMAKAMAEVYAANNEKTLLLELDLYSPTMATLYDLQKSCSLLDISLDASKKGIFKINQQLDIIASKQDIYPAKFLLSDEVQNVLKTLKEAYTHIVVTLPPVLENSDILLFKDFFDAILLVAHKNQTKLKDIYAALDFIKKQDLPYVGTMMLSKKGLF